VYRRHASNIHHGTPGSSRIALRIDRTSGKAHPGRLAASQFPAVLLGRKTQGCVLFYLRTFSGFTNARASLLNADAGAGKEIAEAASVIALSLNEKILAMTMAWVIKRGGEKLIPLGVGFETQGFRLQGAIETEGDLVGFAIELGNGHGGFKISFAAGKSSTTLCRYYR
jgi:hypothetical protein